MEQEHQPEKEPSLKEPPPAPEARTETPAPPHQELDQRMPMGQWLIENMPRGINLEIPDRRSDGERKIPFSEFLDEPEDS